MMQRAVVAPVRTSLRSARPNERRRFDPRALIVGDSMQLRLARLCLDCDEVHDGRQCPLCASETFVYLTKWVPVPERRIQARPTGRATAPRLSPPRIAVGCGVAGAVALALARWYRRAHERLEEAANREAGELK